jgi:S-(hydroxymethyl)glutathione dehydrogenase/alcohol dehydrogenase
MRAVVLREPGKPLVFEELALPALRPGQVQVRMQLAAVCGSQKLEVSGARGPDRFLPHLIGHEGVGIVETVGPGVVKVAPGDQVVLSWIRGSGRDGGAVVYESSRGPVNAGAIATFCERPVVSEQCVTRVDPPVDPDVAVLAGCAIPTGAGAVLHAMPAPPDGAVAILGAGGVGLAAVCGAVLAGWPTILVADLRPARLERARQLGATHGLHAGEQDLAAEVRRITGAGCDLVVECAGSQAAMEAAVRLAKPCGGKVVIVGNLPAGGRMTVDPFDLISGRSLCGSWGGGVEPDRDIPRFVRLMAQGIVKAPLLLGARFPLQRAEEAIQALSRDEPGRPIIDCRVTQQVPPSPAALAGSAR